jgi:cytoskeletal protein RodZ
MTGFVTKKIQPSRPRTLGSILKAARSKANITLEDAEIATRIRLKHLEALERGDYQLLPADAYNIGFIRCYAEYLKLSPEKVLRLYREERSQSRLTPAAKEVNLAPVRTNDWKFLITPKVLGIASAVLVFGGIVSYIVAQLNQFTQPPTITLASPSEELTSETDKVNLKGAATEGAIVFMNSEPVLVTPSGQFSQDVQLSPGINEVVISARSRAGKESQKSVKILFKPNLAQAQSGL